MSFFIFSGTFLILFRYLFDMMYTLLDVNSIIP